MNQYTDHSLCDPFYGKHCPPPPQSTRASTRKRKSSVDTKEPDYLNGNASLNKNDGTKPRWRRAVGMQERRDSRQHTNDIILLCPDDNCRPPELLVGDDESSSQEPLDLPCLEDRKLNSPITFRTLAMKARENGDSSKDLSPTGVVESGQVHFWQRSMAWSDDEGEDDDDESCDSDAIKEDICHHLCFPQMLGNECTNQDTPHRTPERQHRLRRPRRKILQHPRTFSLDIFRAPDPVEHTSEIFWEEKVFTTEDLEKMATLAIGEKK